MTKKRPIELQGTTTKCPTPCGAFYLTLNKNKEELFEVVVKLGKSGNCVRNLLDVIGIYTSILLQSDIPKDKIIKTIKNHLQGISCGSKFKFEEKEYLSCIDFMAQKMLGAMNEKAQT